MNARTQEELIKRRNMAYYIHLNDVKYRLESQLRKIDDINFPNLNNQKPVASVLNPPLSTFRDVSSQIKTIHTLHNSQISLPRPPTYPPTNPRPNQFIASLSNPNSRTLQFQNTRPGYFVPQNMLISSIPMPSINQVSQTTKYLQQPKPIIESHSNVPIVVRSNDMKNSSSSVSKQKIPIEIWDSDDEIPAPKPNVNQTQQIQKERPQTLDDIMTDDFDESKDDILISDGDDDEENLVKELMMETAPDELKSLINEKKTK